MSFLPENLLLALIFQSFYQHSKHNKMLAHSLMIKGIYVYSIFLSCLWITEDAIHLILAILMYVTDAFSL